jgi:YVTN family beta-propeller protein
VREAHEEKAMRMHGSTKTMKTMTHGWIGAASCALLAGCAADARTDDAIGVTRNALANRAYVVSRESEDLTVIDLEKLEVIGRVPTNGLVNHMAEISADFEKVYIVSSGTDEVVVVDARALEVVGRIPVGRHPTHVSMSRDGRLLAVMDEDEGSGAISFIDTERDVEIKRVSGLFKPHYLRWSLDGRQAYVANINAHHLTRIDVESLEIVEHIPLADFAGPPAVTEAPDEGGFADAQIGSDGVLYAAHAATGRVLVYDTLAERKLPEIRTGRSPWIVFAEHPFVELAPRYLGPNFGDATVSMIDGEQLSVIATLPGDREAYGVNYSSQAKGRAFVMNRSREDVAVVDTERGAIMRHIDVGGTTETASTSADGKLIVATVSSANRVVVIDAKTERIVETFDAVGSYPWSVTIPNGQNYCH